MTLAIRHIGTDRFYAKGFPNNGDPIYHGPDMFFGKLDYLGNCKLFPNIQVLEAHFEARLMNFDLNIKNIADIQSLMRIMEIAKHFEIYCFDESSGEKPRPYYIYDKKFVDVLRDLTIFQVINVSYNRDVARLFVKMVEEKTVKKYIVQAIGELTLDEVKSVLGENNIYHESGLRFNNKIFICTDHESDVNLIKLCFNVSTLFSVETNLFNSLF